MILTAAHTLFVGQVLKFVESKMHSIAPNLSLVCGSEVAAKLMGVAGGLIALSKMPSCNVQVPWF
jgi:U4/U6 small nuclear ribonucleoprotein PRP31